MTIQENVPLAPLTTFNIGGSARYFMRAKNVADVEEALQFAASKGIPFFVLGGGSNILVADEGFAGLVVQVESFDREYTNDEERVLVTAGAGVIWDELARETVEKDLAGLECMSGVPGTVGGAIVENIGCYGAQVSDTFANALVLDTQNLTQGVRAFTKEECMFSYHGSIFNKNPGRYIIFNASFTLVPHGKPQVNYTDHRFAFVTQDEPSLASVRESILTIREQKGVSQGAFKSAGSFFSTLYLGVAEYKELERRARALNPELESRLRPWAWEQSDGSYKVAAGFLLEFTEYSKGYVRGGVGVSPKHQLSLINVGGARAREVADLAHDMQTAVEQIFSIHLEREVEYVGAVEKEK